MKKVLTLFAAVFMLAALCGAAMAANYDLSVFDDPEKYEIDRDGGSLLIVPVDAEECIGIGAEKGSMMVAHVCVTGMEEDGDDSTPPFVFVDISCYYKTPVKASRLTVYAGGKEYVFDTVFNDITVEEEKTEEHIQFMLSDESVVLLEDIARDGNAFVLTRLSGEREAIFMVNFDAEVMGMLYEDYIAAGCLEFDFTILKAMFPCTIQSIN